MSSLIAFESTTVADKIKSVFKSEISRIKKYHRDRHILKSKENTYRYKCDKVLKRKLKQYKLRHDGKEDQDVLDVSKILVTSLIIKSPNHLKEPGISHGEISDLEDWRPKNYLFKMVRRKEAAKISDSLKNSPTEVNVQGAVSPLTISSQDKKQTNAFKLLMDSRNKSIGGNSPGKEKVIDNLDEEVIEKKTLKAKRHLLLQKMAETKGSIKNKEMEEYQDNIIKVKMEKRAERLKNMILKDAKGSNENTVANQPNVKNEKVAHKPKEEVINNSNTKKQQQSLKIVDLFNAIDEPLNISPVKKYTTKEDQEFLKKLSPSLKKKESMLSYFKKVDKELDGSPPNSENDNLIKVKLQPRNKKKGKKKKLSLKRDVSDSCDVVEIEDTEPISNGHPKVSEVDKLTDEIDTNTTEQDKVIKELENIPDNALIECVVLEETEIKSERQKRKRTSKLESKVLDSDTYNDSPSHESRPKRSVKRPVKYNDEACISSSDEDLHIFTPKKKKHSEKMLNGKSDDSVKSVQSEPVKLKFEKVKNVGITKKPTKLAPIFAAKQDPAALEAKQKFLQSGVPDKLKKIMQQQKKGTTPDTSFPVVVHVQQTNTSLANVNIPLTDMSEELCIRAIKKDDFKKLLHLNEPLHAFNLDINCKKNAQSLLQSIKQLYPKFPVYRTYRYLRGKGKGEFKDCNYVDLDNSIEVLNDISDVINDSPDRLNWTDKYKAMTTNQIIGNFTTIKELRKWLISWTENEMKSKNKNQTDSDSSDFYQSDTDSRDSMRTTNNLLILTGPTGCGKTASVYAVASDLAMKVIEVNASSRRTGKIMLQDLQEATQSHKVNRGNIDNSQKSIEKSQPDLPKHIKKRGRPKKNGVESEKSKKVSIKSEVSSGASLSQESTRTDSSLILIDDADVVFDQDDGFTSAIVQLVQCSKRPVILITSSLVCPHLQRFLQNGKILKMCPLLPRMLGTWLDIMCLADSGVCWPGVGAKFLNYFNGDIRKTINYLQFCVPSFVHGLNSEEDTASQEVDSYKANIDEEGSCMSWADNDDSEGRTLVPVVDFETPIIWSNFAEKHSNLLNLTCPVQLFDVWWSIPSLLSTANCGNTKKKSIDEKQCKDKKSKSSTFELEALANAIEALSLSDYICHLNPESSSNIASQPWYSPEGHSVSERESLDDYHKEYNIIDEICQTMVRGSIADAQAVIGCDTSTEIQSPGMTLHRERDKVVSRHKNLASYLNVSAVLDRRALALDYWSSCRTICRFEKSKNDTNMKRNNRFCHYLKSLSVLCKSDSFDNLCDSLCSNEELN